MYLYLCCIFSLLLGVMSSQLNAWEVDGLYVQGESGLVYIPNDRAQDIGDSCNNGTYDITYTLSIYYGMNEFSSRKDIVEKPGCPGYALCEPGYYCSGLRRLPCPDGTFSSQYGAFGCKVCPEGHYCRGENIFHPAGRKGAVQPAVCSPVDATSYCPLGSAGPRTVDSGYYSTPENAAGTFTSQTICQPGSFCAMGRRQPCPFGTYGKESGLTTALCSGLCAAPLWCPHGTVTPHTNISVLDRTCVPKQHVHYSLSRSEELQSARETEANLAQQVKCPRGCYCESDGKAFQCPEGRAGEIVGETSPQCSAACAAGWYCPAGSMDRFAVRCGHPTMYCPEGSAAPTAVPPGFIAFGGDPETRTSIQPCPLGYYCLSAAARPCRAGLFGDKAGQADPFCSGFCSRGYICGTGAVSSKEIPCGDAAVICPMGSFEPVIVPPGFRSARLVVADRPVGSMPAKQFEFLTVCVPSDGDIRQYTATLSLGDMQFSQHLAKLGIDPISGVIAGGAEGRPFRLSESCKYYTATRNSVEDPRDEVKYLYASFSDSTVSLRDIMVPCQYGHVCRNGSMSACPGGFYADTMFATDCVACPAGYFCPPAVERPIPCGNSSLFCPALAAAPALVPTGYYSLSSYSEPMALNSSDPFDYVNRTDASLTSAVSLVVSQMVANRDRRTHVLPCPPGTYCTAGEAKLCPSGMYGANHANANPTCDGLCSAGHYCTGGSYSATQWTCGFPFLFCPSGSVEPLIVSQGHYTLGGRTDKLQGLAKEYPLICNDTLHETGLLNRIARAEYPNSDCVGPANNRQIADDVSPWLQPPTIEYPCKYPPSRLLGPMVQVTFNPSRACIGTSLGAVDTRIGQQGCELGYFCRFGFMYLCPPGRFGGLQNETRDQCQGSCRAGFYCPSGSSAANQLPCGNPSRYCPAGSGYPRAVDIGFYTDPIEPEMQKSSQSLCEPGYYCVLGIRYACPAGTVSPISGAFSLQACASCPPGFYCPKAGQSDPTAYPCGGHRGAAVYCPPHSVQPTAVSAGYYSIGGVQGPRPQAENITRFFQAPCPVGHYCADGILRQCPAGRFGATELMTGTSCSGSCTAGYFCPPGSTRPDQFRCGDIYIVLTDLRVLLSAGVNLSDPSVLPDTFNDAGPMITQALDVLQVATRMSSLLPLSGRSGLGGLETRRLFSQSAELQQLPQGERTSAAAAGGCFPFNISDVNTALASLVIADNSQLYLMVNNISARSLDGSCAELGYGYRFLQNPQAFNITADGVLIPAAIPFESGMVLKLPTIAVTIDSLLPIFRSIVQGGPSAVFCPAGSGLPEPVPLGYYSTQLRVANSSVETELARQNMTQDAVILSEPGYFSVAGIKHPCQPGLYGNRRGLHSTQCAGLCPAGYYCPMATGEPLECSSNTFSTGAASRCTPCKYEAPADAEAIAVEDWPGMEPGQTVLEPTQAACKTARSCCQARKM